MLKVVRLALAFFVLGLLSSAVEHILYLTVDLTILQGMCSNSLEILNYVFIVSDFITFRHILYPKKYSTPILEYHNSRLRHILSFTKSFRKQNRTQSRKKQQSLQQYLALVQLQQTI